MSTSLVIWIGALVTLGAFSYLFKENFIYRAVEHIYVGASAGYAITMGYNNLVLKAWEPTVEKGQYQLIVPVLLGLMLFAPYMGSGLAWMRRYPLSFIIGIGAGITIRSAIIEQFVKQIAATALPLNSVNNIVIVVGVVTVLSYFFFTLRRTPLLNGSSELGKWIIMVTFGAAFGNAVMGRISLLIGRVQFLFRDWIHLIKS